MAAVEQWLVLVCCVFSANCQNQYYDQERKPKNPYDNTYVYNNRRYGAEQDNRGGQGDPYSRGGGA